jgi:hypothetical protein
MQSCRLQKNFYLGNTGAQQSWSLCIRRISTNSNLRELKKTGLLKQLRLH